LAAPPLLGSDDWAFAWVYRNEGAAYVQKYMTHAAHPGYAPLEILFFWLGGESAARVARAVAILFHLLNGWLLWRIFRNGSGNPSFAASLAVLYLVAPFLGGLDFIFTAAEYDVFIFFYLFSIWVCSSTNVLVITLAVICALMGLALETLAALEPIRWWLLYRQLRDVRAVAWRAAPFALVILLAAVLRLVWIHPAGVYFEYNAIQQIDLGEYLHAFYRHLSFFLAAIDSVENLTALARYDSPYWLAGLL